MQLYLIRHAQSANNALWAATKSSNGRLPDPPITEIGQQQAQHLADFLAQGNGEAPAEEDPYNHAGFNLTHLYCSLMLRAVQTGVCLAQRLELPLVAWEEIHEWGGIYEHNRETDERTGLPGPGRAFFTAEFPDLVLPDGLTDTGWWNRPHEPRPNILARARQVLADLLERHEDTDDRVALITHGGFIQAFYAALFELTVGDMGEEGRRYIWFGTQNASIARIDLQPGFGLFVYSNRVDYLPAELITG